MGDLVDCRNENEESIDFEDEEAEDEDEEDYVPEEDGEESDEEWDDDNESELTENDELAKNNNNNSNGNDDQRLLSSSSSKTKSTLSKSSSVKGIELELCPEAVNDKIFYMDFKQWSKDFTKKLSNSNVEAFQRVIAVLNESDKKILKNILC